MAIPGINSAELRRGVARIERLYKELEGIFDKPRVRRVFRESFKNHATGMVEAAKGSSRRNRGALARTIGVRFSAPRGGRQRRGGKRPAFEVYFGYRSSARSGRRRVSQNQMLAQEYGTDKIQGTRAIREAWDSNIGTIIERVGNDLGDTIVSEARRMAGGTIQIR